MQYSTMAKIANAMQKIVEKELTRAHQENGRVMARKVELLKAKKIDNQARRARFVVLSGGKPE